MDKERLRERLIQLTRDLVLIESTDSKPDERKRCFQFFRNHLEEVEGITIEMHEKDGYESLVALPKGKSRPDVLFCGHLDVVEHPESNHYRSELRDGCIIGPGAGDMKGQLAIILELFRDLHRKNPGTSVGLAITSDEERGGENGVKFLVEEVGLRCGVAIIPDGGSLTEVTREEKGILHLRLHAKGEASHAARPWLGDNPLERLIKSLAGIRNTFDEMVPDNFSSKDQTSHWFPTCAVTNIMTPNDSPNRIPEIAEAVLDVRFPPPDCVETMHKKIASLAGKGIEVEIIVAAEPTHLKTDKRFVEISGEVAGKEAKSVLACGGSDGRFFSAENIPVMLSRPYVGNLHGRDEWIEIDSMLDYFEICRRYVLERMEHAG